MVPGKRRLDSSRAIEEAVYELLRAYIEEQPEGDEGLLARLRKLRVSDAVIVCKNSEHRFKRLKDQQLKPAVERAISTIRNEEEDKAKVDAPKLEDFESDFEGVDPNTLMDVKDTNQLNKSVTSLWNIKPAEILTQPSSERSTPAPAPGIKAEPPKREEKEKKSKKKGKKLAERKPNTSITLGDLGGIDKIIGQVMEMIAMPLVHPEVYSQIGSDIPPRCSAARTTRLWENYVGQCTCK
jgi:ribosome biogenesis ATPase